MSRKTASYLPDAIFVSRWLQAPLYLGLILIQAFYVYRFFTETFDLLIHGAAKPETEVMMAVLGLIDVVMISNLLTMVIIGGYETFVSRLNLEGHPDRPEWLDYTNSSTLKIKLSLSLITISSVHLLETFINIDMQTDRSIMWQIIIFIAFVVSALAMAAIDRMISHTRPASALRRKTDK